MASNKITIDGIEEAKSGLNNIANSLTENIRFALEEAAAIFIDYAQSNAPVDTGFLRDSILITDSGSDTSITITSEAGYSGFVEYGTRKMDSQPFFEPAIDQASAEIERIIIDAISPRG